MRFASAAAIRAGLPLMLTLTAADLARAQSAPPVLRSPPGETPLKGTTLPLPLTFSAAVASPPMGECSGMSNGPGGIFRVGLLTSEGAQALTDVTFKIRSGPFGTRCRWVSQPVLLPEGVRLTAVEVIPTTSSQCSTTAPAAIASTVGFTSTGNPVRTPEGTVVGANPLGDGYPAAGLAPMTLVLSCNPTLANDHFATMVLASLTFVGPPNLTGFP